MSTNKKSNKSIVLRTVMVVLLSTQTWARAAAAATTSANKKTSLTRTNSVQERNRYGISSDEFGTWQGLFEALTTTTTVSDNRDNDNINSIMKLPRASETIRDKKAAPIKIYVYSDKDVGTITKYLIPAKETQAYKSGVCGMKMYGSQVHVHEFLMKSNEIRTENPSDADFFFLPGWPKCMLDQAPNGAGVTDEELGKRMNEIIDRLPYIKKSGGRDHVFVWPSGRGPTLYKNWRCKIPNSIFLTPEGFYTDPYRDLAPYFDPWKDVVIPGFMDARKDTYLETNKKTSKRTKLASFAGTVPDGNQLKGDEKHVKAHPRERLLKLSKKFPDDLLAISGRTPKYAEILGDSKFCIVPRGLSPWTLRTYETFFAGCVPVIISDSVRLPFQEFLDWSKISIKWPEAKIDESLLIYLKSIPDEEIEKIVKRGEKVRCVFAYQADATKCNAFSAIMWALSLKDRNVASTSEFALGSGSRRMEL